MRKWINKVLRGLSASILLASQADAQSVEERLLSEYQQQNHLSSAYYLARLNHARGDEAQALRWLKLLVGENWQAGINPADFPNPSPAVLDNLGRLRKLMKESVGSSQNHIVIPVADLYPESLAYLEEQRALVIGSLKDGRLLNLSATTLSDLNLERADWGISLGIKYDRQENLLWVVHHQAQQGMSMLTALTTEGTVRWQHSWPAVQVGQFNDLCLLDHSVFLTDSTGHQVFKMDKFKPDLVALVKPGELLAPNGIACDQARQRIFIADAIGLYQLTLNTNHRIAAVTAPKQTPVGGIDGLYYWQGELIGVQNSLGSNKVVVLNFITQKAVEVQYYDTEDPDLRVPTTGFIAHQCFYYIQNSSMDATPVAQEQKAVNEPIIAALPLVRDHVCPSLIDPGLAWMTR
ncbi:NHL repeat-containing protein [Bowmanella dokdonensis]|uniref:Uncharacterized protein n=1 Tax=Bowmanella dokdonensis TaxID=751969 RepID=A0A939IS19_9ALTE|nr:hypothetical protein [Bowmanella dokdonensis]MBN7826709.1 hypothetical protein [Bowmanella dokdonensis]